MATKQVAATTWRYALAKWAFGKSYYPQLGLLSDDTLYENQDVKEAIRRLPGPVYDERCFRIARALEASNRKQLLPKEEWVQYENDTRYLQPYLEDVVKERKEREEWNKQ